MLSVGFIKSKNKLSCFFRKLDEAIIITIPSNQILIVLFKKGLPLGVSFGDKMLQIKSNEKFLISFNKLYFLKKGGWRDETVTLTHRGVWFPCSYLCSDLWNCFLFFHHFIFKE